MKAISQVIIAVAVATGLTLGAAGAATAQAKPAPVTRARHGDIRVDFLIDFTFHAPALHVGANQPD